MFQRILALLIKELLGLWKDRKTRFVILVPPLLQVFVFAHAATYDVTQVRLGIWNDDAGAESAELVRRFAFSPAFHVTTEITSTAQAARAIDTKEVAAVLHVPQTFSADRLAGRTAQPQLLLDTRRSNTALLVEGYATSIVAGFAAESGLPPITLATRDWFNPNLSSRWFILPGLVAVLSAMMSMLVSALSLARERELGTLEQLLLTPLRPFEILVGKAVPGIVVGLINANIVILASVLWFQVPLLGNVATLEALLLVSMVADVGIGLVISTIARTQQQAMLGVFVLASPMVVLSGYAAPVENMPTLVEWIGRADPIRWMLVIVRALFLQGEPSVAAAAQAVPIMIIGIVTFLAAWIAVRRAVS